MPVKKSKVKSQSPPQRDPAMAGKSKVAKPNRKTQNTQRVRKSDPSDIQKIRRSGTSEFSESSGRHSGGSLSVDLYDVKGRVVGKTSLPKELFGACVNPTLMAQAVRVYLANQRKGTASTKTRGEVTASTRKIYRQKGTGRARHGAISAPIFVGGGVVFGPKPRDFSLKFPKKMKRKALISALTSKLKEREIKVVDGLEKIVPKTKEMYKAIEAIIGNGFKKSKGYKVLLVLPQRVESVVRAARNIEGISIRQANLLNTYEVLNNNTIFIMKDAIKRMEDLWTKQTS